MSDADEFDRPSYRAILLATGDRRKATPRRRTLLGTGLAHFGTRWRCEDISSRRERCTMSTKSGCTERWITCAFWGSRESRAVRIARAYPCWQPRCGVAGGTPTGFPPRRESAVTKSAARSLRAISRPDESQRAPCASSKRVVGAVEPARAAPFEAPRPQMGHPLPQRRPPQKQCGAGSRRPQPSRCPLADGHLSAVGHSRACCANRPTGALSPSGPLAVSVISSAPL
jgi:hypothetical protein